MPSSSADKQCLSSCILLSVYPALYPARTMQKEPQYTFIVWSFLHDSLRKLVEVARGDKPQVLLGHKIVILTT